jgi:hypothetical protein
MGDVSKGVANTSLARQKNIQKRSLKGKPRPQLKYSCLKEKPVLGLAQAQLPERRAYIVLRSDAHLSDRSYWLFSSGATATKSQPDSRIYTVKLPEGHPELSVQLLKGQPFTVT